MVEKTIPWWRKALHYALGGIRAGFSLFSRPAKPAPPEQNQPELPERNLPAPPEQNQVEQNQEEENQIPDEKEPFLQRPEASQEVVATVDPQPAKPESLPAVPDAVAAPPPAPEPSAEPVTPLVAEPVAPLVAQPAADPEPTPAPIATQAEPDPPAAEPEPAVEAVEPLPIPVVEPAEIADPAPEPTPEPIAIQAEPDPPAAEPEPAIEAVEPLPTAAVEPAEIAVLEPEPIAPFIAESIAPLVAQPPAASEPTPEPIAAQTGPEPPAAPAPVAPKPLIKLESRDNQADLSPFSVIVSEVYDGPLDLLLDLIRKQDIDIYDIPIAKITAQFLAYVNQLKAGDVDVAGEFIYIASLLIHIKSRMLLPRSPSGPEDAAEDPRRELVERLLAHERFKNAAQMLQQKQMLEAATWSNPGFREFQHDAAAEPEIAADTVDLVRIFRDILDRARNRPVLDVEEDSVTVGQMIQFLARRLTMEDKPVALRRLLSHTRSERALIAMFLALLELVRLQAILLRQDLAFSEIFIKKHTGFESVMNQGLANARDDWR
jgi:segregation and condensation protein A